MSGSVSVFAQPFRQIRPLTAEFAAAAVPPHPHRVRCRRAGARGGHRRGDGGARVHPHAPVAGCWRRAPWWPWPTTGGPRASCARRPTSRRRGTCASASPPWRRDPERPAHARVQVPVLGRPQPHAGQPHAGGAGGRLRDRFPEAVRDLRAAAASAQGHVYPSTLERVHAGGGARATGARMEGQAGAVPFAHGAGARVARGGGRWPIRPYRAGARRPSASADLGGVWARGRCSRPIIPNLLVPGIVDAVRVRRRRARAVRVLVGRHAGRDLGPDGHASTWRRCMDHGMARPRRLRAGAHARAVAARKPGD